MRTATRRSTRTGHGVLAVVTIFLFGMLSACGGDSDDASDAAATPVTSTPPTSAATTTTVARPSTPVDELVLVGGGQLHIRCSGTGDATVVLIAGFTGGADDWAAVEPTVAEETRVCAYDRFGTGTSDPPPTTQTFATQARDLRALLQSISEPGPYVLVGHSFGGAAAVTFASLYSDEVRGLLLLDASPIDWDAAVCGVPDDGSPTAAGWRQACALLSDPANNPEHLDGSAAFAEVATITSLDALPMIVATAPERADAAGLPREVAAAVNETWNTGQDHWVSLSSSARLVTVAETGHYIQNDQPGVVIDQIRELLR